MFQSSASVGRSRSAALASALASALSHCIVYRVCTCACSQAYGHLIGSMMRTRSVLASNFALFEATQVTDQCILFWAVQPQMLVKVLQHLSKKIKNESGARESPSLIAIFHTLLSGLIPLLLGLLVQRSTAPTFWISSSPWVPFAIIFAVFSRQRFNAELIVCFPWHAVNIDDSVQRRMPAVHVPKMQRAYDDAAFLLSSKE